MLYIKIKTKSVTRFFLILKLNHLDYSLIHLTTFEDTDKI